MASVFQKLLGMGGKQIAKRGSTELAQEIAEEAPEVIGKGTSKLAKEASEEIPEAAYKEITPTTGSDDMSLWNRLDKKKAAALLGLGGAGAYMMSGDEDKTPPMVPQAPLKAEEPKKPEEIKAEAKKTVNTEEPKKDGLDFDALAKKFDEGMAGLPEDADVGPDFAKMLEEGITKRNSTQNESDLLRASENLAAGLARIKPDYGSSTIRKERADQHKKDSEDKVAALQKQQAFDKAKADMNDETKMRDPKSEISKLVSELAAKTGLIKPGQSVSAMSLKNAGVNLGNLLATIEAGKARKEAAQLAKETRLHEKENMLNERQRKFTQGLRKEATTGVLGKQYATYATGQRISNSLEQFAQDPSGYKDYATLMGGLKALQGDESVVREAEVRMGMSATSAIDSAMNYLQKAANGKMLQPNQRKEMVNTIKILTDASKQQYMHSVQPILEQAQMEGIDPELILSGSLSGARSQAVTPANNSNGGEAVKVMAPNGKIKLIPADQVDAALAAGGKRVQ